MFSSFLLHDLELEYGIQEQQPGLVNRISQNLMSGKEKKRTSIE